jgi:hypothetical protein
MATRKAAATPPATVDRQKVIKLLSKYKENWCDGGYEDIFTTLGIEKSEIPEPPYEFARQIHFLMEVDQEHRDIDESMVADAIVEFIPDEFDIVLAKAVGRRKAKIATIRVKKVADQGQSYEDLDY